MFAYIRVFSPILNTSLHPEEAGLVERGNQTFKKITRHVVVDNPIQWRKIKLFAVWAPQEVSNATTGYTIVERYQEDH